MRTKTLEKWTWVLIFGGLLLITMGLAVVPADSGIGFSMAALGAAAAVIGAVLIYVRSRMKP